MSKTILVIDDDGAVRSSLEAVLAPMNYRVLVAADGIEGYEKFRHHKPHLVITDIIMPGQEGIETIMKIRKDLPGTKIIAMSGGGRTQSEGYLGLAEKIGADVVLNKPFDFDVLMQAVEKCLA